MKIYNDYILPKVGKCLVGDNKTVLKGDLNIEYEEVDINTDKVSLIGDFAIIDNKICVKGMNYKELKTNLIKKLFSNDDQIAIILNNEKTMLNYMNGWREWIGNVCHKIIELRESSTTSNR